MFIQLMLAGIIGGLIGHLIAYLIRKSYHWLEDKYIDIGSPWDDK